VDVEYLPSIERAKFERRKQMPDPKDENTEGLKESMGMGEKADLDDLMEEKNKLDPEFTKPDLDEIEDRIDEMMVDDDDCDQEEPMTTDRKIYMLSKIFEFAIGDRVKNLLDEKGIIDLVGLDRRGVLYLVQYKENIMRWEPEESITKIPAYSPFPGQDTDDPTFKSEVKTDIPQKELNETKESFERKYTGQHRTG
jgi:hypothetical protein